MICTFQHKSTTFEFDSKQGFCISIPVSFSGRYLSAFGVGSPTKKPYKVEGFTGSVHEGGSCNCDVIEFIPHCHTTHTECVGHVLEKPIFVRDVLQENLFLANLITVIPSNDAIDVDVLEDKKISEHARALIIRTFPNESSKKNQTYESRAPYLTPRAIEWINDNGIEHLLVDFPSIDPMRDNGKLAAHRAFWNLSEGQKELSENTWKHKTVTELIYAPNAVADGSYMLDLQTSHMNLDAVPSTPTLYPVRVK